LKYWYLQGLTPIGKRVLLPPLVENLGEAGIDPNDIMVFFLETDRASGSFGGGRFAPPVAFA
jgi:hypothetical protein